MKKRALLIGIDHYCDQLHFCGENDAMALAEVLNQPESAKPNKGQHSNFICEVLASNDSTITKEQLHAAIRKLFAKESEVALLYFSGHGYHKGQETYLAASGQHEGVSVSTIVEMANTSGAKEVVILLDACHCDNLDNISLAREGISILCAAKETHGHHEGKSQFSESVVAALVGGAADILGHVTASSIYQYLQLNTELRPDFKTSAIRFYPLIQQKPTMPYKYKTSTEQLNDMQMFWKVKHSRTPTGSIKPITKESEYDQALNRIDELWGAQKGTPEGDEFEVWITLIEAYEAKHYPIKAPDPIKALTYYMEQKQLKRSDMSPYFGSKSLVSDVLNGKKNLTLKMIKALHNGLGIPYEMLIT